MTTRYKMIQRRDGPRITSEKLSMIGIGSNREETHENRSGNFYTRSRSELALWGNRPPLPGSGNARRDLLSSPSKRQILDTGAFISEPLSPRTRGKGALVAGASSYSSMEERSTDELDVDVGDNAGDWTISCKKEGSRGAGACKPPPNLFSA